MIEFEAMVGEGGLTVKHFFGVSPSNDIKTDVCKKDGGRVCILIQHIY